jgi:PAS domain
VYSKGGGFGTSTYRLQNKTGEFIFLRTHGHLEYDKETNKPISFICVNTLLSKSEGWKGLGDMKQRFSAKVENKSQEAIMASEEKEGEDDDDVKKEVRDFSMRRKCCFLSCPNRRKRNLR